MLKRLLLLAFLFLPFLSNAQFKSAPGALTFTQFTGLFAMDQATIVDYMTLRGWEFEGVSKDDEYDATEIKWSYQEPSGGFIVGYTGAFNKKVIGYGTDNQAYYNNLKAEAMQAGLRRIDSGVKENIVYSDYEAKNFVMVFEIEKIDGETFYITKIYNKAFYYAEISNR